MRTRHSKRRSDVPLLACGAVMVAATATAFGCAASSASGPASPPPNPPEASGALTPDAAQAPVAQASALGTGVAGSPVRTVWDGVFTTRQARRGQRTFNAQCGSCHEAREFGAAFPTAFDLFTVRFTMPEPAPDSLTREEFVDIIAHVFNTAGMPAGETELPVDDEALKSIHITPRPGGE